MPAVWQILAWEEPGVIPSDAPGLLPTLPAALHSRRRSLHRCLPRMRWHAEPTADPESTFGFRLLGTEDLPHATAIATPYPEPGGARS